MASVKNKIPSTTLTLGLAGLLPFFASAAACFWPDANLREWGGRSLAAYAAVILSFLGGVKWGVLVKERTKLKKWKPITLSVLPSVIAWLALLLPVATGLSVLIAGLLLQFYLDRESVAAKSLPVWYGRLRLYLSLGAIGSVLAGLVAQFV